MSDEPKSEPSPKPSSEKPSAQGYIKDKPSNESQDKQLKEIGIGPGGGNKEE